MEVESSSIVSEEPGYKYSAGPSNGLRQRMEGGSRVQWISRGSSWSDSLKARIWLTGTSNSRLSQHPYKSLHVNLLHIKLVLVLLLFLFVSVDTDKTTAAHFNYIYYLNGPGDKKTANGSERTKTWIPSHRIRWAHRWFDSHTCLTHFGIFDSVRTWPAVEPAQISM